MNTKRHLILLVVFYMTASSYAEYRIWMDAKGNAIEAELDGVDGKKIILITKEGKTFKLSPTALSEGDQKFIKDKVPASVWPEKVNPVDKLRLEADFSKSVDSRNTYYDDVVCKATLTKKSIDPFEGKLKIFLYVIGESSSQKTHILCDKSEHVIDFKKEREVTVESNMFTLYDYSESDYGAEYEGYVIVVEDMEGNEVFVKSSKDDFAKNRNKIAKFKRGDYFSKKYKVTQNLSSSSYYY